jgi:gallate decarboxylase subunit D
MMRRYESCVDRGRTRVVVSANRVGEDVLVTICNRHAHVGAVAVAEWDRQGDRVVGSLVTRVGHREDSVVEIAATQIAGSARVGVCVVGGIHLDGITHDEIRRIMRNCETLSCRVSDWLLGVADDDLRMGREHVEGIGTAGNRVHGTWTKSTIGKRPSL